jgi:hypothetical protein
LDFGFSFSCSVDSKIDLHEFCWCPCGGDDNFNKWRDICNVPKEILEYDCDEKQPFTPKRLISHLLATKPSKRGISPHMVCHYYLNLLYGDMSYDPEEKNFYHHFAFYDHGTDIWKKAVTLFADPKWLENHELGIIEIDKQYEKLRSNQNAAPSQPTENVSDDNPSENKNAKEKAKRLFSSVKDYITSSTPERPTTDGIPTTPGVADPPSLSQQSSISLR